MKKKFYLKATALSLIVAVFFQFSANALTTSKADELTESRPSELLEPIEPIEQSEPYSEPLIIGEDISKRTEYTKTFFYDNGTDEIKTYDKPVHILQKGEWVEIDNSFIKTENGFKNKAGAFDFLSDEINKAVTLKNKDSMSITWSTSSNLDSADTKDSVKGKPTSVKSELYGNEAKMFPERIESSLLYEKSLNNVDIKYSLSASNVMQDILIDGKNIADEYYIDISLFGLTVKANDNNTISFYDKNDNVAFYFNEPGMMEMSEKEDYANSFSSDFKVILTNSEKDTCRITLIPDKQWLNDKDRLYPVTIKVLFSLPIEPPQKTVQVSEEYLGFLNELKKTSPEKNITTGEDSLLATMQVENTKDGQATSSLTSYPTYHADKGDFNGDGKSDVAILMNNSDIRVHSPFRRRRL